MEWNNRTLHDLLHSLPQELYDKIYDNTFECSATRTIVRVTEEYSPPALLQVNHETRAKFAEGYYSKSVFVANEKLLDKFVYSLPSEHVEHFGDIRSTTSPGVYYGLAHESLGKLHEREILAWYSDQTTLEHCLGEDGLR